MASTARQVARVRLPTRFGEFDALAFEAGSAFVHLALCRGEVAGAEHVLTRLHSECLTGDALGSVRCDCGVQLRMALQAIAAEDHGVVIYATGHEGRGIGLVNKLRAYLEQERGADTVDANLRLGLPVDSRSYTEAAAVLRALQIRSVRLLTNNPAKVEALRRAGIDVHEVRPMAVAGHVRNLDYLRTKEARLGHVQPRGEQLPMLEAAPPDVNELLGPVVAPPGRPFVVLKYAQTLDGRIATATGDSKWISGEEERCVSHALRAACDAVLVGVDTVVQDDPRLTVRMVPGSSPLRIVVDSTLRIPPTASILDGEAPTMVLTTDRSDQPAREALRARNVAVHVLPEGTGGVDLTIALSALRKVGVHSLLVEGGARIITSFLMDDLVDRLIVSLSATIIGQGTEAVGDLGIVRVADGIRLARRRVYATAEDVLIAGDVVPSLGETLDFGASASVGSVATG
ncbi:MAG: GTP cyclohydrolase II [Actinomycetota bacterium]|nr:GTP cyclohydrolase II [Actinomycetota bacterium]